MLGTVIHFSSACWTSEAHALHGSAALAGAPMQRNRKDPRVLG